MSALALLLASPGGATPLAASDPPLEGTIYEDILQFDPIPGFQGGEVLIEVETLSADSIVFTCSDTPTCDVPDLPDPIAPTGFLLHPESFYDPTAQPGDPIIHVALEMDTGWTLELLLHQLYRGDLRLVLSTGGALEVSMENTPVETGVDVVTGEGTYAYVDPLGGRHGPGAMHIFLLPEPAPLALLASVLCGVVAVRRRRGPVG